MPVHKTIKGFIVLAAVTVSIVLSAGVYLTTNRVYQEAVRKNAAATSATLAEGTFNAMFQIMRQGWTRPQVEEFIAAVQRSSDHAPHTITIYRGDIVTQLFGPIQQPPMDELINEAVRSGEPVSRADENQGRFIYPLRARQECLRCHINAHVGSVMGVIEVKQDLRGVSREAQNNLLFALILLAPLPVLGAIGVAYLFQGRINRSLGKLQSSIDGVNKVSDLKTIEIKDLDLGFEELNTILGKVAELGDKLRTVAVDKDLLEFEIRLLEKFVITSDVVRDWREYIGHLLVDINQVIEAYTLFSIFKVDDELFDLEIFWIRPPSPRSRAAIEVAVHNALRNNPNFGNLASIELHHHVALPQTEEVDLALDAIELQTKSLFVETPKIGGIVGIGVHADILKDETRLLVMESILSTLLNVVGSVKAIYKYTKDLEYYATRDPLTNLYNQRIFWELLGYEVKRAKRHDYSFALLVIDLDNFKSINDTYGHAFGDRFLQEFADAVHGALRNGDIFARYGGDEFVLILPEAGVMQTRSISERILDNTARLVLEAPDGAKVKATVSIGVAIYPEHAEDVKDLFLFADNMMYKAKAEGKNRIGIPTAEDVVEIFRNIGEKSIIITNAVEEKRVVPFFQPIVDSVTGNILAVEVLSRIELPDGRLLGAHEFIEIAEKAGLIHKVDFVVMERTFAEVNRAGYEGLIFLNLSPRALLLGTFLREIKRLTHEFGIPPSRVVFEITERDTVKNFSLLEKFINDLKMEGFKLAIDDFGSGFSSFHYLKRFPIDFVKIEGDFVVNMVNDKRDAAFVRSIAALAEELGIHAVAEFVESPEVLDQVRRAGIAYAQGFHIGRPNPSLAAHIGQTATVSRL